MEKWTENRMAVSADALNVLLNAEGNLDFNLVRPNPAGLDITDQGIAQVHKPLLPNGWNSLVITTPSGATYKVEK